MGTKRIGLARTQALIESLKRELRMGGAEFSNVKGVQAVVYSEEISSDAADIADATGVSIPANAVITDVGVVVTTGITLSGAATLGVTFGTAAEGEQIVANDADSLATSGTTLAAGKGTSTDGAVQVGLGGAAALAFVADSLFSASARTVYGKITHSAEDITAGAVRFWVKYVIVV